MKPLDSFSLFTASPGNYSFPVYTYFMFYLLSSCNLDLSLCICTELLMYQDFKLVSALSFSSLFPLYTCISLPPRLYVSFYECFSGSSFLLHNFLFSSCFSSLHFPRSIHLFSYTFSHPLPKSRTIYLAHIHVISFFFFFFSSQHSLIYLYSSSIFTPPNFSSSNPSSCCSSSLPFKLLASRLFLC